MLQQNIFDNKNVSKKSLILTICAASLPSDVVSLNPIVTVVSLCHPPLLDLSHRLPRHPPLADLRPHPYTIFDRRITQTIQPIVAVFSLVHPPLSDIGLLRAFVIKILDQLKMGKGPATVKTIAATMSVILLSSLMNVVKIQNKGAKLGTMSPIDQVLWRTQLLEASLIRML
ncbi:B-cell receptor-associated protein 31 [Cucumis melo var. makuwa]|uniref:B-cell receptor-associated protein 31 n=2 Tax=Cucumis melo TaxID=3656 RepID=A0A5A7UCB6_CUCMM|nr:B-cell receptor-associated protein 31 [Cucumis melo var. makuwa]